MENKITLTELTDLLVAKHAELSATEVEEFLKTFFDLISETLIDGDQVKIKDLGTFKLTRIKARESVDVNTGEKIEIPEHSRVSFSPATALKELVNKPFSQFESVLLSEGMSLEDISSFSSDEDEADDEVQEEIQEKIIDIKPETDKITETIQMAADQLKTELKTELKTSEKAEEDSVKSEQTESLPEADDKVLTVVKEQVTRKKSKKPSILIPVLGGIAIAAASFFFLSFSRKP